MRASKGSGAFGTAPDPSRLTIVYDERCGFCLRARDWLLHQPCLVAVELIPASSPEAQSRFARLGVLGEELVVADDRGNVWLSSPAFIMCLWATARYRGLAMRLAGRHAGAVADRFFEIVSDRRDILSRMLGKTDTDAPACQTEAQPQRWEAG